MTLFADRWRQPRTKTCIITGDWNLDTRLLFIFWWRDKFITRNKNTTWLQQFKTDKNLVSLLATYCSFFPRYFLFNYMGVSTRTYSIHFLWTVVYVRLHKAKAQASGTQWGSNSTVRLFVMITTNLRRGTYVDMKLREGYKQCTLVGSFWVLSIFFLFFFYEKFLLYFDIYLLPLVESTQWNQTLMF